MRKRRKRRKTHKRKLILLVLLLFFSVIIVAWWHQSQQLTQKKSAAEYFEIFDTDFLGRNATSGTVEGLLLHEVYFKVRAVGGDAHSVHVTSKGMVLKQDEPWFETIEEGGSEQVILVFNSAMYVIKEEEGYPFSIRITSREAEGEITIHLTEGGIFPPLPPG